MISRAEKEYFHLSEIWRRFEAIGSGFVDATWEPSKALHQLLAQGEEGPSINIP